MAAKIIIYNNVLDYRDMDIYDISEENITVEEFLRKKNVDKVCRAQLVEVYDPEKDEVIFCPLEDNIDNPLNISLIVNGKPETPDYVIKENDSAIVQILPADSAGKVAEAILGGILIIGAVVLAGFTAGASSFLAKVGIVLVAGALAVGGTLLLADALRTPHKQEEMNKDRAKDGGTNPTIAGSQNQPLDGPFPLIVGRITDTPYIVGSIYNEYIMDNEDQETYFGIRQKATELLAIGYAPLFVKDIKFDNLPVIHNKNNILSGLLPWEYIQPQTDGPKYVANPNNPSQPITFNGKNSPYEVEAMWNSNKIHMELSQFGAHRTLYPFTVKQKQVDAHLLYCYDQEYREVAGEKMITWQGGQFPTGFRTNTIRLSEAVPRKISVGIEFPQGLYRQHVTEEGDEVYSKIPMNLLIQWRPHYKYIDENNLDTFGEGEDVYDPSVDDVGLDGYYSEKRYYGWRNFTISQSPVVTPITYTSGLTYNYRFYVYKQGTTPAKQGDWYGYYFNTTGLTLTGRFVKVSKIMSFKDMKNNIRAGLIERFYSKSLTNDEYSDLQRVVRNGVQVGVQLYQEMSFRQLVIRTRISKSEYEQSGQTSKMTYDEYVLVSFATYSDSDSQSIMDMFVDVRASSLTDVAKNDANWCNAHRNRVVPVVTGVPTAQIEVKKNLGLSEGTDYDCNPNFDHVNAWSFGPASCGYLAWKNNATDPSSTEDWQSFTDLNITNGAKNQMRFELSVNLSKEDILDLLNKNPKSKRTEEMNPNLAGLTEVSTDSVDVRVIRLTPCYINKTDGKVHYTYCDMVKWMYIKTECMDKQKLLDDINNMTLSHDRVNPITQENETRYYSEIDCDPVTYDDLSFHNPLTWLDWNINNYKSKPLSAEDEDKLALLAVECEPDLAGQISSSIDKVNLTAYAVTPTYTENWTRYWYNYDGVIKYRDYYDDSGSRDLNLHPVYSPDDTSDDWKTATQAEYDAASSEIILISGTHYGYQSMLNPWDGKFFPEKVETTNVLELQADVNGNVLYNEHGTPLVNMVKYGNNWIRYISRLMSEHKDSAGRWVATDAFISAFTEKNAIAQALGVLIGQSLGKDAYNYNSTNYTKYVRYWHVRELLSGEKQYWYRDVDDIAFNPAREMPFTPNDGIWIQSSENAWLAAERIPLGGVGEFTDDDSYSFRRAESSFNMLLLKEAFKYTDAIDIGGPYGPLSYKCNMLLNTQQKTQQILTTILNCGRAYWFYDELGRIEIHNEKPRKYPAMIITDENIISSSFTRSFQKGIAGYHVSFQDENNGFLEGELYVLREGQDRLAHTRDIVDLQIQGITDPKQMWGMAVYLLGQTITTRESWEIKLNHAGTPLAIGSMVELQSSVLEIGTDTSGRISKLLEDNYYIYGFIADRTYDYRAQYNQDGSNVQGCSLFQGNAKQHSKIVTVRFANEEQQRNGIQIGESVFSNLPGQTNLVLFEKPIIKGAQKQYQQEEDEETGTALYTQFALEEGDIIAFGNVGSTTSKAIVYQLQYDENSKVTASLYPYFDELYSAGNKMPVYTTNMTKRGYEDAMPVDMSVNRTELNDSLADATKINNQQIQGIINGDADASPPNPVRDVAAKAYRDQIDITWKFSGTGLNNTIDSFTVVITKKDGTVVTAFPSDTHYSYVFTRFDALGNEVDGYPEAADLEDWTVTVTPVNVFGLSGTTSTAVHVNADADHYGTWIVSTPVIATKVVDRTIILQLSTPRTASNREIYGDIRYQVRVRRGGFPYTSVKYWMHDTANNLYYKWISNDSKLNEDREYLVGIWKAGTHEEYEADTVSDSWGTFKSSTDTTETHEYSCLGYTQNISADTEWHKPTATKDPYTGSDNYYDTDTGTQDSRYVIASATYTQTMPLYYTYVDGNNDIYNLKNTPYFFDVRSFNEAGSGSWFSGASDWSSGHDGMQVIALCTNIQDIVKANETAKTAYVEDLSSISAHLGEITDGSLFGSPFNYWTLQTKRNAGSDYRDYIGAFRVGDDKQSLEVRPIIENGVVVRYEITFNVGNFSVSSTATEISGDIIVQEKPDSLDRTKITPHGTYYQHRDTKDTEDWYDIGKQETSGLLAPMLYSKENLVITNSSIEERRANGVDIGKPLLSQFSRVYHFDTDKKDNTGNINYTIDYIGDEPVLVDASDNIPGFDFTPAILAVAPYSEICKSLYGQYTLAHGINPNSGKFTIDFWLEYIWADGQILFKFESQNNSITCGLFMSEPNYNEPQEGEPPYNTDTKLPEGHPYNVSMAKDIGIIFLNGDGTLSDIFYLSNLGITFEANEWIHFAIVEDLVQNIDTYHVYINNYDISHARYSATTRGGYLTFNPSKDSFILDEFMLDPDNAETLQSFSESTVNRIPYGKLDWTTKHFILEKSDDAVLHTNLFDTELFNQKVQALFNEYNKYEIGFIQPFAGVYDKIPNGWFLCVGQAVSRIVYADLFVVIGTTYGAGDGSTTFNLPDLREVSLAGAAPTGAGTAGNKNKKYVFDTTDVNPATGTVGNQTHDTYTLGQFRDDQFQGHEHSYYVTDYERRTNDNVGSFAPVGHGNGTTENIVTKSGYGNARYGSVTRGKRLGVYYIIRAF